MKNYALIRQGFASAAQIRSVTGCSSLRVESHSLKSRRGFRLKSIALFYLNKTGIGTQ